MGGKEGGFVVRRGGGGGEWVAADINLGGLRTTMATITTTTTMTITMTMVVGVVTRRGDAVGMARKGDGSRVGITCRARR